MKLQEHNKCFRVLPTKGGNSSYHQQQQYQITQHTGQGSTTVPRIGSPIRGSVPIRGEYSGRGSVPTPLVGKVTSHSTGMSYKGRSVMPLSGNICNATHTALDSTYSRFIHPIRKTGSYCASERTGNGKFIMRLQKSWTSWKIRATWKSRHAKSITALTILVRG